jgi:hypothetical protein
MWSSSQNPNSQQEWTIPDFQSIDTSTLISKTFVHVGGGGGVAVWWFQYWEKINFNQYWLNIN